MVNLGTDYSVYASSQNWMARILQGHQAYSPLCFLSITGSASEPVPLQKAAFKDFYDLAPNAISRAIFCYTVPELGKFMALFDIL